MSTITLLGTHLEGGGQLLRNAVCLSALLNKAIHIPRIRGNRHGGGGLKNQHLVGLLWLSKASGATVEGAFKGGKDMSFFPSADGYGEAFWETFLVHGPSGDGKRKGTSKRGYKRFIGEEQLPKLQLEGDDEFGAGGKVFRHIKIDIGSPGSIFLVFQAILPFIMYSSARYLAPPPASSARERQVITLTIKGGTNTTQAPSYEYTSQVLLPVLREAVGLPAIRAELDRRCWASGSPVNQEVGSVTFEIEVLLKGEALKGFVMQNGDGLEKQKEGIAKVTATIVVPNEAEFATFERMARDMLGQVDWNPGQEGQVEVEISPLSMPTGGEEDRNYYVLLHVTTSPSGYRMGYDIIHTASSKPGRSSARKVADRKDGRNKSSSTEALAETLISKPLGKLLRRWRNGNITDEYLQDELVIWQALADGLSFVEALDGGEERGASNYSEGAMKEETEIGSLHTRTARWVMEEIAGTKWVKAGKGGCKGIGLKAGSHERSH